MTPLALLVVNGVITPTSVVNGASSTLSCTDVGYTGRIYYSCSNAVLNTSGSCTAITCNATSGTGYTSQSGLEYTALGSGTFSCDISAGYTGSKTYTCAAAGAATITGRTWCSWHCSC